MAALTAKKAKHATLAAGVEDIVTLTQRWDEVEVLNRHATAYLSFRTDNVPCVVDADDTFVLAPGAGLRIPADVFVAGSVVVRLNSVDACLYSVTGTR